ncbi:hypothetical protein N9057_00335 [Akkermansiaceae bacterium]|nr:hypothetical protein [Akkermansiaceae bacterium]
MKNPLHAAHFPKHPVFRIPDQLSAPKPPVDSAIQSKTNCHSRLSSTSSAHG